MEPTEVTPGILAQIEQLQLIRTLLHQAERKAYFLQTPADDRIRARELRQLESCIWVGIDSVERILADIEPEPF